MMLCGETPDAGGASWLVDGYALMDALPPRQREALFRVPTEDSAVGAAYERRIGASLRPDLVPSTAKQNASKSLWRSPLAQRTPTGRILLRAPNGGLSTNHINIDQPVAGEHEAEGAELIESWRAALRRASPWAPRFRVHVVSH